MFFSLFKCILGEGLAFLQVGDENTSTMGTPAMRRMQELLSPNEMLRQDPTAFQISISLKTLESLGMTLLESNARTTTNAFMTTTILGVGLALFFTI